MKSEIYKIIAFVVFFVVAMFLFRQWIDYQMFKAEACGHVDRFPAIKLKEKTFVEKNEIGEDGSCYVFVKLHDGWTTKRSQYWNVGNCDGSMIEVNWLDYTCHTGKEGENGST